MTLQEAYKICTDKAHIHMSRMQGELYDLSETRGNYYDNENKTSIESFYSWTASFATGMGAIMYQTDNDKAALDWANSFKKKYHDKVFAPYTQTMHDLGFLYLPYSVHLYRLTGDTEHRDTALRGAEELAKRFNIHGKYIDAWSEMDGSDVYDARMIIDSCMNAPLLFWAWQETGHMFFREVAAAHLETAVKMLLREDNSVAHAWKFDLDGNPIYEINSCGFANGSHWARGTGWFVYGMAMAYEYTNDKKYLDYAIRVGEKYLECVGDNPVPVWDFRLPKELPAKICGNNLAVVPLHWDESKAENIKYAYDTSAAAIMCCAFQLITKHIKNDSFSAYIASALDVLSNEYLNTDTNIPGMLRRSNGRDAFSIYGDYYYMLALANQIYNIKTCWGA